MAKKSLKNTARVLLDKIRAEGRKSVKIEFPDMNGGPSEAVYVVNEPVNMRISKWRVGNE